MLVVVKIGTDSVIGNVEKIANDIIVAKKQGIDIILVSSGAIGMGKKIYTNFGTNSIEKQVLASMGQHILMNEYKKAFERHGHHIGQILITKNDTERQEESTNLRNVINTILSRKDIIPIVNENDTVSIREIMFTDNDELAGTLAVLFCAKKLIILTNIDGVYDDFSSPSRKIIPYVHIGQDLQVTAEKSLSGRGGMQSKVHTAFSLAKSGITTIICNVNINNVIIQSLSDAIIGTSFLPEA